MMPSFLVGLTGGSGVGKTAVAVGVALRFGPQRTAVLSQDAYYRDRRHLSPETRARLNYDTPDAFDRDLIVNHLRALRAGAPIPVPVYSYVTHTREPQARIVAPRELVLVEGLMLLADPEIASLLDLRIFLDAPEDVRYRRRLARDTSERARSPEAVREQWDSNVCPAHRAYVEPSQQAADTVIANTGSLERCVDTVLASIAACIGARVRAASTPWGSA